MDTKALAKSKRYHSLHHKKKHQAQHTQKAPSVGSDDKKPTGKQAKEKHPHSHIPRSLPSNWGRYDEDVDLGSEEAQVSSSVPTESVLPKSKGADYAYLISEAKAQSQAHCSSDVSPLFDDLINDFSQDFGPLLAAKGQSILSWITDDSFEFEGKASNNLEAPFLSLNLNALAEQLAKAKLSERLYLEPNVLPAELLDDQSQQYDEEKHRLQTSTSEAETNSGASSLGHNQEVRKNVEQHHETASSTITVTGDEEGFNPVKQNKDEIFQSQGTERSIPQRSVSERGIDSTSGKPPIFEASSAEAELDMLLSSFDEAKVLDSSSSTSSIGIASIAAPSGEDAKKVSHTMEPAVVTANIDDDIDKLLEETSNITIIDGEQLPHGVKASTDNISSTMQPNSKSKLLDDFDSWLDTI